MTPGQRGRYARRLACAAVLLSLLTGTACAGGPPPGNAPHRRVVILGPWTGVQEKAFRTLLRSAHVDFTYQGTAAQREVLLSQVQAGDPPDIAVMPSPGELADYARKDRLKPLNHRFRRSDYAGGSAASADAGGGGPFLPHLPQEEDADTEYWVPVKADLKSIVWYRGDRGGGDRGGRPDDDGTPPVRSWCLGMLDDGASGWPGTDWIEDMVLQRYDRDVYEAWAGGTLPWTDRRLVAVWRDWGAWLAGDGQDSGGSGAPAAERALTTDHRGLPGTHGLLFGGAGKGAPPCSLEHQGSFARSFYGTRAGRARFVPSSGLLPGPHPEGARKTEVTADFAVLFTDNPQAAQLLEYLASSGAQERWTRLAEKSVYSFSASLQAARKARDDGDSVTARLARQLTDGGTTRCLDASDAMPPSVRDAFYEAVLRFLSDPRADPRPLLRTVQKAQDEARRDMELTDEDEPWLRDLCSSPPQGE